MTTANIRFGLNLLLQQAITLAVCGLTVAFIIQATS